MAETWQEELIRDGTLRSEGLEGIHGLLGDRDYAFDALVNGKFAISATARAITETASPLLRQLLLDQLNACIREHFQLADLVAAKDWYRPHSSPDSQVAADMAAARAVAAGQPNA